MQKSQLGIVFPGQGSQHPGMLAELADNYPQVEASFAEASDVLGYDLWALTQTNPDDKLNQTEFTQPALLTASVAMWRVLQHELSWIPAYLAGHSLGEYSALVCANALSLQDAVKLVALRGRLMQQAVPAGVGAMAAIIGLDDTAVNDLCASYQGDGTVSCANYNSPGQVVIAGDHAAVMWVIEQAKPAGAKMAKALPVSVPSHCQLMQPAADEFAAAIHQQTFAAPMIPVIHNVDATSKTEINDIKAALIHQLSQPVLWVDSIKAMHAKGVRCFIECGPGKVLTGLIKRIEKDDQAIALSTTTELSTLTTSVSLA